MRVSTHLRFDGAAMDTRIFIIMIGQNDSFIVYCSLLEQLDDLTDEQVGRLFRALMTYQRTGNIDDVSVIIGFDPMLTIAFKFVKYQMDANNAKYERTSQRRAEAGRKGADATNDGKSRQNSAKTANAEFAENETAKTAIADKGRQKRQKAAKSADNENDNDNDNDNDNENENISFSKKEKEKKFLSSSSADGVTDNAQLYDDDVAKFRAECQMLADGGAPPDKVWEFFAYYSQPCTDNPHKPYYKSMRSWNTSTRFKLYVKKIN